MRLVDADKLMECAKKLSELSEKEEKVWHGNNIVHMIELTPTAYDVDKVIRKLKEASYYDESGVHTVIGSGRAIGIVEKGGMKMTIIEAIEFAMEQQEIFDGEMGEFLSQVVEWLEELKECREETQRAYNNGYNKAVSEIYEIADNKDVESLIEWLEERMMEMDYDD